MGIKESLLAKVRKGSNEDDCWSWRGSTTRNGYGQLTYKREKYAAHRLSYELHKGYIPEGLVVMHICDVKSCVNPLHLLLGTQKENVADYLAKGLQGDKRRFRGVNGNTKIKEEHLVDIAIMKEAGLSNQEIGNVYGVSRQTIWAITKNWESCGE